MKYRLKLVLKAVLAELVQTDIEPQVSVPENPQHGDYSTNIAMVLAKKLKKKPMDIALEVKRKLDEWKKTVDQESPHHSSDQIYQKHTAGIDIKSVLQDIKTIEIASPGFLNLKISEANLINQVQRVLDEKQSYGTGKILDGTTVMVEFAHPNTHKAFHIGHLRNITTGEAIVRLLESQGAHVIRANYQGDVGMHIAKALYALSQIPDFRSQIPDIRNKDIHARVEFLGKAYAAGSKAYEENDEAKAKIGNINIDIYAKTGDTYALYQETRKWSLEYFEGIYERVGSHFDRYYFESEVYESGKKNVLDGVKKGIFTESKGAVIFPGEKFGLHNRVFITGEGNPTYEGKDMGLGPLQFTEYHPDRIVHVVGPEQASYFQVIFEALGQLFPETKGKEFHLIYGWVKLKHGKMSSRTGNVVLGEWLLDEAKKAVLVILKETGSQYDEALTDEIAETAAVAAAKYAFLKVATQSEIAFDFKESVAFDGDSGPYLLYTYARSQSVIRKAGDKKKAPNRSMSELMLNEDERNLARSISEFSDVVEEAVRAYAPNGLCRYLFDLAQYFNLFYSKHQIIGSESEYVRLALTAATAQVLQNGLTLLGIGTVERM